MTLVDELIERHPIDPDRIYVTGVSMGGRGAWYLAFEQMHQGLKAAGGASELEVLPGRDHSIADVLHDPELYRWLLQHRRRTGDWLDQAEGSGGRSCE